jgi:N-acetylglutamate synthase-like GNAT family acetyltransferase
MCIIIEVLEERINEILEVINTSNLEAYKSLIPEVYLKVPVLTLTELQKDLERMTFYGGEINGQLVGVAALDILGERIGRVRYVYILQPYQRKGIGTPLVQRVERLAKDAHLKKLRVLTVEKAVWAISFYTKLGYRFDERIQKPWGFDVFLEKDL